MIVESAERNVPVAFYDYLTQSGWTRDIVLKFLGKHLQGELPLIVVKNISVAKGSYTVLDNVSLDVFPGEVLAIIGRSGSGKTTLIETIAGIITPAQGMITIKSGDTNYVKLKKQKASIGVSMQSPSIYKDLTVEENLYHFARLYGIDRKNTRLHVTNALSLVGLGEKRNRKVDTLTAAEQKIVDIALALIHGPQVVLLDHPFEQLDSQETFQIKQLIRKIHLKGVTVIITAPSLSDVMGIATRVATLDQGKIQYTKKSVDHDYTIVLKTADGYYDEVSQLAISLGAKHVQTTEGRLICETSNPSTMLKEMTKQLLESNKQITELWCDQGVLNYGAQ